MSLVAGKLKYQRGLERLEKTNISKEESEEPLNYIQWIILCYLQKIY